MSVSSPAAVNEQGDDLSSGSEKSSSSKDGVSSFRQPSTSSLSSSSRGPKSFSSVPASGQATRECREPQQEGETEKGAGRRRRSCRGQVLSGSFPSPLFDALVLALVEKYADPEGLVGLLESRCTPTRIQQREEECSHLPDSVSSSASLPSPAFHLGRLHDEEPEAHACRQANAGGSNAERLQPAASTQPPGRDRRVSKEANETRSSTLLLFSCPIFVLLRALVNRLCERSASLEACDEEGIDSSDSYAATRREGHRDGVPNATLSARGAANLGGDNRGSKEGGQENPSCQDARRTCATSQPQSSHGSATARPLQGASIRNAASPASPRSHFSFLSSYRRPRPAETVVECLGLPLSSLFCVRPLLRKEAQESLDLLAGEAACRLAETPSESSRPRRFTSVQPSPVSCGGGDGPRSDRESSSASGGDDAFVEISGLSGGLTQVERCLFRLQKLASELPFSSTVEWQSACVTEGLLPVLSLSSVSPCDGSRLCSNAALGTCSRLGDARYGAAGRGDSARTKEGERGDWDALLDDLWKRRMMNSEEEDVGGLCVEQAEAFLEMCLSLHAPRRTFTASAFPSPQEPEDDNGEVQEVGGSSASARRSAGLNPDGRACEDAANPTSGSSTFTSFPFLQYFWNAENMPSSQAWALRQARPVFVDPRQEASFYRRVSSAANELLSVFVTSQERKAKALLVGLANRQLATRSRQPGCGRGRISVAQSLSPRKATNGVQVNKEEGCEEGEDAGDDYGDRRTTPLSPHDLKAHLLLYVCGNNELNTTWRHLGARLLLTLPATNLATLRDVLPVQDPRYERCLSGALSCHELVSLLFRFFAPFADERVERKETRSQTRRLFNPDGLEEMRENSKDKQHVQPIQLLTEPGPFLDVKWSVCDSFVSCCLFVVLGLVATSATLCDPGAPHALRVVALLSLQNVRPPGGKHLSPSLRSSLAATSSLSSPFPASRHVGSGHERGLSTAARSRHAEPGRAENEPEPANETEIEDFERLARTIGCASPSMALITSTVAQISRENDAPALLNLWVLIKLFSLLNALGCRASAEPLGVPGVLCDSRRALCSQLPACPVVRATTAWRRKRQP
ncbi:UNVERIFIED_CONTAM: hypothetical protein HHA_461970 [Hammondia hammondi]|eukprot:XP_008883869.1 hypothetical protein HHA_461970 [Hammondia hammondi]